MSKKTQILSTWWRRMLGRAVGKAARRFKKFKFKLPTESRLDNHHHRHHHHLASLALVAPSSCLLNYYTGPIIFIGKPPPHVKGSRIRDVGSELPGKRARLGARDQLGESGSATTSVRARKMAVVSEIACAKAREAIVKDQLTALYEKYDALIEERSSLGDEGDDEDEDEVDR
jgi:hypothetical protein